MSTRSASSPKRPSPSLAEAHAAGARPPCAHARDCCVMARVACLTECNGMPRHTQQPQHHRETLLIYSRPPMTHPPPLSLPTRPPRAATRSKRKGRKSRSTTLVDTQHSNTVSRVSPASCPESLRY